MFTLLESALIREKGQFSVYKYTIGNEVSVSYGLFVFLLHIKKLLRLGLCGHCKQYILFAQVKTVRPT